MVVPGIPINSICPQIIVSWNEILRLQSWSIDFSPPVRRATLLMMLAIGCPPIFVATCIADNLPPINDFVCSFFSLFCHRRKYPWILLWTGQFTSSCSVIILSFSLHFQCLIPPILMIIILLLLILVSHWIPKKTTKNYGNPFRISLDSRLTRQQQE